MAVSDHYALVIPVLNPKIRLACTLLGQEVSGTLAAPSSPNANEAILSNVPPHAHPQIGDTITTSGLLLPLPRGDDGRDYRRLRPRSRQGQRWDLRQLSCAPLHGLSRVYAMST